MHPSPPVSSPCPPRLPYLPRLSALAVLSALSGCTVGLWHYQRIEAPAADYLQARCQGRSGPPELAYYPFNGIFISLALDPLQLGLHIPRGQSVALADHALVIAGPGGDPVLRVTLKAARTHVMADDDPAAFSMAPDPYTAPDNFGPLRGGAHDGFPLWYLFDEDVSARAPDAPDPAAFLDRLKSGTVQVPALTINGRTWPAQVLPFTRTSYQEVETRCSS